MSKSLVQDELDWAADLETLSSSLSAGLSELQALHLLASRATKTWRSVFVLLATEADANGLVMASAKTKAFATDSKVDLLCEMLLASNRFGSTALHITLAKQASRLRQLAAVRQGSVERVKAVLVVARIAAVAPWLLLLMLCTRSENRSAFASIDGLIVLVGGAALTAGAMAIMLRIAKLPSSNRVLDA